MKFLFEDGPVDLAQGCSAFFILDTDDDAIRMEEILHGGAFAQEFGIGRDLKLDTGCGGIGGKRLLQLEAGERRDGAFFHHKFRAARLECDLPRDVVDGGEIGRAGVLRRRAYADENNLTGANGFTGIGSVDDFLFPCGALKDFVEMFFVNWNFAGFQLVNAILVDVRAENLVAGGRKACSRYQSHVATPDYRQSHLRVSLSQLPGG